MLIVECSNLIILHPYKRKITLHRRLPMPPTSYTKISLILKILNFVSLWLFLRDSGSLCWQWLRLFNEQVVLFLKCFIVLIKLIKLVCTILFTWCSVLQAGITFVIFHLIFYLLRLDFKYSRGCRAQCRFALW